MFTATKEKSEPEPAVCFPTHDDEVHEGLTASLRAGE